MTGNTGWVILLALVISEFKSNVEVITKPNATAYRGGHITLPCQFNGDPALVCWYKHNHTGAPDEEVDVVVMNVVLRGTRHVDHLHRESRRYSITPDYSLIISDVGIGDETTYSCQVVLTDGDTGRNYTDLKVIDVEVTTKPNATAYRGGNITLSCQFSGDAYGVYWYKHNHTGAPDAQAEVVASIVGGGRYVGPDKRYNITLDHSLELSGVVIGDETTYSCKVVLTDGDTGRNYTDLKVIALANPLHPVVQSCKETAPGKCDYVFVGVVEESFPLTCRVDQVHPAVSLAWRTLDGRPKDGAEPPSITGPDQNGLRNVSSMLTVLRTEIGEDFVCMAEGPSVNGTSSLIVSVKHPSEKGLSEGGKAGIAIVVILMIAVTVAGYFLWWRTVEREGKRP